MYQGQRRESCKGPLEIWELGCFGHCHQEHNTAASGATTLDKQGDNLRVPAGYGGCWAQQAQTSQPCHRQLWVAVKERNLTCHARAFYQILGFLDIGPQRQPNSLQETLTHQQSCNPQTLRSLSPLTVGHRSLLKRYRCWSSSLVISGLLLSILFLRLEVLGVRSAARSGLAVLEFGSGELPESKVCCQSTWIKT